MHFSSYEILSEKLIKRTERPKKSKKNLFELRLFDHLHRSNNFHS